MRPIRVYRLDITYPSGSEEPGWEPVGWGEDGNPRSGYEEYEPFRWPRERLFLSKGGADQHADLFRACGAQVTVVSSLPVEWAGEADEAPSRRRAADRRTGRIQRDILRMLAAAPAGLTSTALAPCATRTDRLRGQQSEINATLQRLERRRLVERSAQKAPGNTPRARAYVWQITDRGRRTILTLDGES